jgi:cyclopropane-fatty-acyl-phospholipid synthase
MLKFWQTPSIYDVIKLFILNIDHLSIISGSNKKILDSLLGIVNRFQHILRPNSIKGAQANIAKHYDLSNEFFAKWLDQSMTYSSALWTDKNQSLQQAQTQKWQRLIDKLQIQKNDKVLEIGSGWGGFALYLAQQVGCKIHTITISKQQYLYAKNLFHDNNVEHLITIELKDYRDLEGTFDKIVSFEMMEAIGHKYMPVFIKKIHTLLNPKGMFGTQIITCPDSRYPAFKNSVDWIQKHIFPGSLLLSIAYLQNLTSKYTTLQLHDLFDMGLDYEKTLLTWKDNFMKNADEIMQLGFDEIFMRKWHYYLDYCAAAFATRNISVAQLCFTKPNNTSLIKNYQI